MLSRSSIESVFFSSIVKLLLSASKPQSLTMMKSIFFGVFIFELCNVHVVTEGTFRFNDIDLVYKTSTSQWHGVYEVRTEV